MQAGNRCRVQRGCVTLIRLRLKLTGRRQDSGPILRSGGIATPHHSRTDIFAFPNGPVALGDHHALRRKPDVGVREHERNPHVEKATIRTGFQHVGQHLGFAAGQLQMSEDGCQKMGNTALAAGEMPEISRRDRNNPQETIKAWSVQRLKFPHRGQDFGPILLARLVAPLNHGGDQILAFAHGFQAVRDQQPLCREPDIFVSNHRFESNKLPSLLARYKVEINGA